MLRYAKAQVICPDPTLLVGFIEESGNQTTGNMVVSCPDPTHKGRGSGYISPFLGLAEALKRKCKNAN